MNKTLSVNIGGIVFHIEELAYDRLSKYLESIKGYFTASDGRDEIIQDIEGRIAEMFQERMINGKQVILDADVDHVMNVMGKPEQFAGTTDEESFGAGQHQTSSSERKAYRRLYRDNDDRVIGGVCSGISHYLGIDPVYLRLIFGIAFFVFGSGIVIYILLMFVMPKAITTAEKLEMKGEPVNISNISKSVSSEFTGNSDNVFTRFFDALGQLIVGGFKLLGKVFAVFFIIIGIFLLIAFALTFLAILGVGGITIPFFITDLFMSPWQQTFAMIGAFCVLGIPLIMLIYKAIKVLFNIRIENKFINWTALALWIVGVVISFVLVSSIGREFKSRETQRIDLPVTQPVGDTLFIGLIDDEGYDSDAFYIDNHRIDDPWDVTTYPDSIRIDEVSLDIVRSNSTNFELVQVNTSRGRDRGQAIENARKIEYSIEQTSSKLIFNETFIIPKGAKYRGQEIKLILKVPQGKSVYMSPEMREIIFDIKNVTNTYDGDMLGKTWTMTDRGLECLGCSLPPDIHGNRNDDIRIRIDGKGVNVEGADNVKDTNFTIDGDDVDIKINKDGIQIDAKKK